MGRLSVLAHLTGWPMPVPGTALLSLLQMMPSRLRDCAISHGVDAAVSVRVPVIARRVSPVGLAAHVSTAIRARLWRGSWLCQREEPRWLAPAYQWTLVLDALKSADRKNPGAGPHPRSPEWERTYGRAIAGDTCARQVGIVQRWYDGAQRDACEMHARWRSAWTARPPSSAPPGPPRRTTTSRNGWPGISTSSSTAVGRGFT